MWEEIEDKLVFEPVRGVYTHLEFGPVCIDLILFSLN